MVNKKKLDWRYIVDLILKIADPILKIANLIIKIINLFPSGQ